MANGLTAEDHVTLNLGDGGAVVATDFVADANYGDNSGPAHFQVIKISTGDVGESALLSTSAPLPVQIWQIGNTDVSNGFLAVRGNTSGTQAVPVSLSGATLEINSLILNGGSIDEVLGASADVRTIAAGITMTVVGINNDSVAVTGDVSVSSGISADIRSLPLPTGMTAYTKTIDDTVVYGFAAYELESGVKIKNYFSGLEGTTPGHEDIGGGLLCVGFSGAHFIAGGTAGFLLGPGEEIFLEIKNLNSIAATSVDFDSGTVDHCIMSVLGT